MNYYEPVEDSRQLLNSILKEFNLLENKDICEVGVGSGFIISNLAKQFQNNSFYGSDINPKAVKNTKLKFNKINKKISLKKGNLLNPFKNKKFDLILFNTPYLPCENNENYNDLTMLDKAIYGGKYGYEVIEEFIYQINDKLNNDGKVYMLFSSLSNKKYIENILKLNLFEFEYVSTKKHFFEELYVLKITKSNLLKNISNTKTVEIKYLAVGKHSINLKGKYKNKQVIIKTGIEQHISKEISFLEKLKKENFTPKIFHIGKNYVIREFFEGITIKEYLDTEHNKTKIIKILNECFNICFKLDKLKITKFEMTNPYKHIYILKNNKVKMIDYERCIFSEHPKNTTQFIQYIRRNIPILKSKGINIHEKTLFNVSKQHKENNFKIKVKDIVYI